MTILLTSTIWSQAQQINPVPDYVFRNQMSVGRNAVTDTAAYFSIGPRYGATKGFMPPIVGDTATFSSGKRNGLLIFSVQKNKFLYWDSVRVQWSDMAGSSGAYIVAGDTSAMLAPYLRKVDTTSMLTAYLRKGDTSSMLGNYIRHAGYGLTKSGQSLLVDTLNISTRAWRQKGIDSLAALEVSGSGTTNYVPKFTAGSTIGNSQIFDNGTNVGIGNNNPSTAKLQITGPSGVGGSILFQTEKASGFGSTELFQYYNTGGTDYGSNFGINVSNATNGRASIIFRGDAVSSNGTLIFNTNNTERLRITSGGNVGINNNNPSYRLDVAGSIGLNYDEAIYFRNVSGTGRQVLAYNGNTFLDSKDGYMSFRTDAAGTITERLRIFANGRVFIGASPTDAGYQLDINGTLRSVNGANFATTSGNVGIGTASPTGFSDKIVNIYGATSAELHFTTAGTGTANSDGFVFSIRDSDGLAQIMHRESAALLFGTGDTEAGRINSSREWLLSSGGTDAGDYKLQVAGNIYNTGSAVLAATSGNVGVGTSTPTATASKAINIFGASAELHFTNSASGTTGTDGLTLLYSASDAYFFNYESGFISFGTANTERGRINSAGEWIIDASGTDAGDYKLQVVGNARIGTGKLDISSNTTFGIGVARSGTSEVAGQIYNSNGILYLGAESSAGGQIFSGSSAYAAVIGSGANYPLQFATNNITRATMTTSGNLLLGFTTDSYFLKLQVNGSIFSNNQVLAQGVNAQIAADSSANISPLYISNQSLTGSSAQAMLYSNTTWNTTGNPSLLDLNVTNTASGATSNYIKITDGTNTFRVTKAAEVVTAAPSGGSIKPWKLGEAATVSPTSPNRTIRVEIDGTVYYLHAKTTND